MSIKDKYLDVSTHNGLLSVSDFKKMITLGIKGVIVRVGYGGELSQKDARFEHNYAAAKEAGMPIGAYHYSYAKTVARAKVELSCLLAWLDGKQFELPIYYDIEDRTQEDLGKTLLTNMTVAFCDGLQSAGYYAGVYASKYWLTSLLDYDKISKYTIWVAQYNTTCTFAKAYDMWQYTSSGTFTGLSGKFDVNWCYKDFTTTIKTNGLNGYTKASSGTTDDSTSNTTTTSKDCVPLPSKNSDGCYKFSVSKFGKTYPLSQNFKLDEYRSKDGADTVLVYPDEIALVQRMRNRLGVSIGSNSSYRSVSHNKSVGGATNSQHIYGKAMDLVVTSRTPSFVAKQAQALGARCTIIYAGFCHVDMRASSYYGYSSGSKLSTNLVTLKQGSSGQHVKDLQVALNDFGYRISVDGRFGSGTLVAVVDFQKKNGLTSDGIVGEKTWKKLLTPLLSTGKEYELTATLNVRKGASTSYDAIAQLPNGSHVLISTTKIDERGVKWGNIGIGWISMKYVK